MIPLKLVRKCPSVVEFIGTPNEEMILPFCSDTRKYNRPGIFAAIPGEKFNPMSFVEPLLKQNCPLIIVESKKENKQQVESWMLIYPQTCFVLVTDVVRFIQELAHEHVVNWKTDKRKILAISGSNGKTTHKEMLGSLLKTVLGSKIVVTEKNNNNHLGVPFTIFNITNETEAVVLEFGSNHPGEIKVLCDIAYPDIGLTTNIGATHLEFFGTEEAVFHEEAYVYQEMMERTSNQGTFFINLDDPFLKSLKKHPGCKTFSRFTNADFRIDLLKSGARINFQNQSVEYTNANITGDHNKQNMAVAWILARELFPQQADAFLEAAKLFTATKNRSEWCEFKGKKVFLDAYNANPSSMKAALEGFFDYLSDQQIEAKQTLVILGDMNELGPKALEYHFEIGAFLNRWPGAQKVFIGRYRDGYLKGAKNSEGYDTVENFKIQKLSKILDGVTHIFIKGSRSLQLESIVDIT